MKVLNYISLIALIALSIPVLANSPCEIENNYFGISSISNTINLDSKSLSDITGLADITEPEDGETRADALSLLYPSNFKVNIFLECELEKKYNLIKHSFLFAHPGKNIENSTQYHALRFIDGHNFGRGMRSNIPINEVYKPRSEAMNILGHETLVWDTWQHGISFIDSKPTSTGYVDIITNNTSPMTLDLLLLSHKRLYEKAIIAAKNISLVNDKGEPLALIDGAKQDPMPGRLMWMGHDVDLSEIPLKLPGRQPFGPEVFEKLTKNFKCSVGNTVAEKAASLEACIKEKSQKIAALKVIVSSINQQFNKMNLLPDEDFIFEDKIPVNSVIMYDGKSAYTPSILLVKQHIKIWINFFNNYLQIIKSNYKLPIPASYPLMTPMQFTAFVQKWFVMVHPFADGNGRTSRVWQNTLLKYFKLPFPHTSILGGDIFWGIDEYYKHFYKASVKTLDDLQVCNDYYYRDSDDEVDPFTMYKCELIK